jgi:hypothetical protein
MIKCKFIAASAFCAALTGPAFACSNFDLVAEPRASEGYNPNAQLPISLQIELSLIDGPAEASCMSHRLEITSRTPTNVRGLSNGRFFIAGTPPADQQNLTTYTGSTIQLSQSAMAQLVSTGRLVFDYALVPPGGFYSPGTYSNILDIELNGETIATVEPELDVFPAMRLLGDVSNGYGSLDFGTLESFDEVASNFLYQSNSRISVTARSHNSGALVHEDGAGTNLIPYSAFINNQVIQPDGVQTLELSSIAGSQNIGTIRLQLGDIGSPVAGDYSDVLILSFSTD